jgi:hypothetical protein
MFEVSGSRDTVVVPWKKKIMSHHIRGQKMGGGVECRATGVVRRPNSNYHHYF